MSHMTIPGRKPLSRADGKRLEINRRPDRIELLQREQEEAKYGINRMDMEEYPLRELGDDLRRQLLL